MNHPERRDDLSKDTKRRTSLTLTEEALRILDAYAKANGLSRSAAVEIAARRLVATTTHQETPHA
jgi:metal-responsive CopG/Arc/MetJ family transcriptional regulator